MRFGVGTRITDYSLHWLDPAERGSSITRDCAMRPVSFRNPCEPGSLPPYAVVLRIARPATCCRSFGTGSRYSSRYARIGQRISCMIRWGSELRVHTQAARGDQVFIRVSWQFLYPLPALSRCTALARAPAVRRAQLRARRKRPGTLKSRAKAFKGEEETNDFERAFIFRPHRRPSLTNIKKGAGSRTVRTRSFHHPVPGAGGRR